MLNMGGGVPGRATTGRATSCVRIAPPPDRLTKVNNTPVARVLDAGVDGIATLTVAGGVPAGQPQGGVPRTPLASAPSRDYGWHPKG